MSEHVMLVVSVPVAYADALRKALGEAGAGTWGSYSNVCFSYAGTGRFLPGEGAQPVIGSVGVPEEVAEERIETLCERGRLPAILDALKRTHPYEVPAFHFFPVEISL